MPHPSKRKANKGLYKDVDEFNRDFDDSQRADREEAEFLEGQQVAAEAVRERRRSREDRQRGEPFVPAKSREDAEILTGRRALVARWKDKTKAYGDLSDMFDIHPELDGGYRELQLPIAQSMEGSLQVDDIVEAVGTFIPANWVLVGATYMQLVLIECRPVGKIMGVKVIQTGVAAGAIGTIYLFERGFFNTLAGVTGILTDYDNRVLLAGPFAAAAAGVVYDQLFDELPYINNDDQPSTIAGALPKNKNAKRNGIYALLVLTGMGPPPTADMRVKITTKEAL